MNKTTNVFSETPSLLPIFTISFIQFIYKQLV